MRNNPPNRKFNIIFSSADGVTTGCHPNCDQSYGCWGPGLDQCVRCARMRAGEHNCVRSCGELPGFMLNKSIAEESGLGGHNSWTDAELGGGHVLVGSPDADEVCSPCHPECEHTCVGRGPHQCIGSCKTAWVGFVNTLRFIFICTPWFKDDLVDIEFFYPSWKLSSAKEKNFVIIN